MPEPADADSPVRVAEAGDAACTIARVLRAVGDKWSLRVLCEAALNGVTRFNDFQTLLGVAPDVLGQRLTKLVDEGLLLKQAYKEPGQRARYEYTLTTAGREMRLVLAALQQWGDVYRPRVPGAAEVGRTTDADKPVRVAFVDEDDAIVEPDDITYRYSI
ncbi:winged helix-turn-helix transcriptional regulator [Actinoplanes sp. HUAS TT8]|uniref:winged helix-turn-helix transcriptional regulator n=1 Tax=Actinoplanes sp. HUAS TT8 TaxID=3447453 RepID=UPI003F521F29